MGGDFRRRPPPQRLPIGPIGGIDIHGVFLQVEVARENAVAFHLPDIRELRFEAGHVETLDFFQAGLGLADGSIDLWKGPIKLQDGTVYIKDGTIATDKQVWYLPALLDGMIGQSVPTK